MSRHPREQLSAYLDGELAPAEQAALRTHLAACAQCAGELEELALVAQAARELHEPAPEGYFDELPGRVRQRLREARQAQAPASRPRLLPAWSWAVAAAALLGLLLPILWQRQFEAPLPATRTAPAEAPATAPQRYRDSEAGKEQPAGASASSSEARAEIAAPKRQGPYQAEAKAADERLGAPPAGARAEPAPQAPPVTTTTRPQPPAERAAPGFAAAPPPPAAPQPMARSSESERDQLGALGYVDGRVAPPAPGAGAGHPAATEPAQPQPEKLEENLQKDREDKADKKPLAESRRKAALGRSAGEDQAAPGKQKGSVGDFAELSARKPASAEEARALAREWQRAAERQADATLADEARLRALEALAEALRLSASPADRAALERAVAAYAARADAVQKPRARRLLE